MLTVKKHDVVDVGTTAEFPTYRSNGFTHVHVKINGCEYVLSDKPKGMSQTTFFNYALGVAVRFHRENKRRGDIRPLDITWHVSGYGKDY
jgi:hypothetical protein